MPNAAICVRVSPRPAENVRYSPEIQESQCREWCEANGHTVVKVIPDILVSGGSKKRFDSVFRALDEYEIDTFVVADLSRWTRDKPSRFWAIKAVLEDRGIKLVSVNEPYISQDMPFVDTITTARVEANYLERETIRRKTREGIARARAQGKRLGGTPFGWTFHRYEGDPPACRTCGPECATPMRWTHDDDLIISFFTDYAGGDSWRTLSRRYGMHEASIGDMITTEAQRAIVPADIYARANERARLGGRSRRIDARYGNLYRGMLRCPFCRKSMIHNHRIWGNYVCRYGMTHGGHPWVSLSARRYVTPAVKEAIRGILFPKVTVVPDVPRAKIDVAARRDRLSEAWIKGRLSEATYDKLVAELDEIEEAQREPAPPPADQASIIRDLEAADFETWSLEGATRLNAVLQGVIKIALREDRSAVVTLTPTARSIAARNILTKTG